MLFLACEEEENPNIGNTLFTPENPLAKSDRLLGIGLSAGSLGFNIAFAEAQMAEIELTEISFEWDAIEQEEGKCTDLFGYFQSIA